MAITAKNAIDYLKRMEHKVELYRKDNTEKMWSYKLKQGSRAEFAFSPNTTRGLYIRADREIPAIAGVRKIESLQGKSVSTALGRVFTGGFHKARYKAEVENEDALGVLIAHFEIN